MAKELSFKEGLQKLWDDAHKLRKINKELKEEIQDPDGLDHIAKLTEEDIKNMAKEIHCVGRCPYCGDEVEIEPTDMCCGEVHSEYVYEDEDGNEYTEQQYKEQKF